MKRIEPRGSIKQGGTAGDYTLSSLNIGTGRF